MAQSAIKSDLNISYYEILKYQHYIFDLHNIIITDWVYYDTRIMILTYFLHNKGERFSQHFGKAFILLYWKP